MGMQVEATYDDITIELTTDADYNPLIFDDMTRTARRNVVALLADITDDTTIEPAQLSHHDAMRKDFLLDE